MKPISIKRAHLHNLQNVDIDIPTDKLVVVTGVSGSGKSSLVFDLVYEEGRRRYLQAIGVVSELGQEKGADHISGLRPTVAVTQSVTRHSNPRSVVGTRTGLLHYFGMLYADTYNLTLNAEDAVSGSHFSFNSPLGMCEGCQGRGHKFEFNFSVLLPEKTTSLPELYQYANMESSFKKFMEKISKRFGLDLTTPFMQLPEAIQNMVLYGRDPDGAQLSGLDVNLKHKLLRGANVNNAMQANVCMQCHGHRLNQESLSVEVNGATFGDIATMSIRELESFINSYRRKNKKAVNTRSIIVDRISSLIARLIDVKLDYLSLYRPIPTLSGGELQRLFLMSFLDSDIESLVYIFDEPTTGLHEIEKRELLAQIRELKEQGNSLIIVEHDSYSIASAEHIIEVGPLAGNQGGNIVYQGDYDGLLKSSDSLTSQYLSGKLQLPARTSCAGVSDSTPKLVLHNVETNNLKSVTATIPLGRMVGIAGVSGSGKSSLIADTLVPVFNHRFDQPAAVEDVHDSPTVLDLSKPVPRLESIDGVELISRCVQVGQEPIGRRTGSNPATYLGIWDRIRRIFAKTKDAEALGFGAGHFSFNTALGACENCGGNGKHQQWLGSLWVSYQCASCKGQRYQPAVLEVRYKSLTITDILNSSITEAIAIFADDKPIVRVLDVLVQTGMGYLTLGQPTSTLSGGEAQRIKLAKELGRRRISGNSLFVLDEPTTGLSLHDVAQMLVLLDELVSQGNTVLIIEHDPMVLSRCDWLLELGPGAGCDGGQLIAQGPPDAVKVNKSSVIAEFF